MHSLHVVHNATECSSMIAIREPNCSCFARDREGKRPAWLVSASSMQCDASMYAKEEESDAATTASADSSHASAPQPSKLGALLDQACSACLRLAVLAFLAYSFVQTARRVRHDHWDLAFVVSAYAVLGMLFFCLRRVEHLTPACPAGERRRLQLAVWALSTVLSCAFAYRVCGIMPAALAVAIWCVTASVAAVGFYCLIIYNDPGMGDCDVSGRKSFHKISPADEMV